MPLMCSLASCVVGRELFSRCLFAHPRLYLLLIALRCIFYLLWIAATPGAKIRLRQRASRPAQILCGIPRPIPNALLG